MLPGLDILLNGLVEGMILVLLATGLSIIFGMLDVVNFAHGSLYMIGAYATLLIASFIGGGLGFALAIAIATAFVVIVGVGLHYVIDRPEWILYAFGALGGIYVWNMYGLYAGIGVLVVLALAVTVLLTQMGTEWSSFYERGHLPQIMFTFGIALVVDGAVEIIAGPSYRNLGIPDLLSGSVTLLGFTYPTYRLFVVGVTIVAMVAVSAFIRYTEYGRIIRAGVTDSEMVRLLGIDLDRAFIIVFAIGALLAGLAGALMAPLRSIHPHMGVEVLVLSFAVIIIGGIGNIRNIVYAGILVGILMSVMGTYYSAATEVIIFIAMGVILLARPQGLFGSEGINS